MDSRHIDRRIGRKLRSLRRMRGMTQQELGRQLRISFQQVQKYEHGVSRMTVSRLCELSEIFGVSLTAWLAEDGAEAPLPQETAEAPGDRMLLKLVTSYRMIAAREKRALLCAVARAFAGDAQTSDFTI